MVRMVGTIGQQGHRWGHRVQLPEVMCGFGDGIPSQGVVCVGWPEWVLCVAVAWVVGGFRVRGSAATRCCGHLMGLWPVPSVGVV